MDVDTSYSSQNSNTPTAQNQPVPNNGGAGVFKFNIRGPVHQFNPTQANQNSGTFNVNQSYRAAEHDDNPTRDIPIGTGQAPGGNPTGNPTRDIPIGTGQAPGGNPTRN